jgi:hypothetical protein
MGQKGDHNLAVHQTWSVVIQLELFAIGEFILSGNLVKMAGSKLQTRCVSVPDKTVLVTCFQHEQLVGHAFASVWEYEFGKPTCTLSPFCRMLIFSQASLSGSPNSLSIRLSASATLRLSSCKLSRPTLSSKMSQSLGWFHLILLCAMPWQNKPVSFYPYWTSQFESDGLPRCWYIFRRLGFYL